MYLLEVFKKISEERDAILLLVGDGHLRLEIENKINQLLLKNRVILTGVRNDVAELMQAMDAFILPSKYEGLGIVVIEAQAAGLPCIVSDKVSLECKKTELVHQMSFSDEPEKWAEVDETLYIRMMINLLSNALRYGEGRDIEVSLSEHNDSDIIGKVKDHGIGISKGDIPHIWERFYRADKSRTGGSHCGLGLSMVKWIAEAHGGSVEVVSKEGEGSEFVFHLRKSKS